MTSVIKGPNDSRRGASTIRRRSRFKRRAALFAGGALLFASLLGVLAWLQFRPTLAKAERLLAANRTDEALRMFVRLADGGDREAQKRLASLYVAGGPMQPDAAKAVPYLLELAALGDADARVMLGGVHYRGLAGKPDYDEAARLLLPFERSDNGEALSLLGQAYYYGRGVAPDADKAFRLLGHAAVLGVAEGNGLLGLLMYRKGNAGDGQKSLDLMRTLPAGVDRDVDLALGKEDYRRRTEPGLAAEAVARLGAGGAEEDVEASYFLGMLYSEGEGVERDFRQAEKYLTIAAKGGFADATLALAALFARGVPEPDYARARACLEAAVADGDRRADAALGKMYNAGQGGPRDPVRAAECLERATDGEHDIEVCRILWRLYTEGDGVAPDLRRAARYLTHVAESGDVAARVELAYLCYYGRGVPVDYDRALQLLGAGLDASVPEALSLRGWMYFHGDGGPLDEMRGMEYVDRAAALGDNAALDMRRSAIYARTKILHVAGIAASALEEVDVADAVAAKDGAAAFIARKKAAMTGDAAAQGVVAAMFVLGHGTDVDYEDAAVWAKASAENGDGLGQLLLGLLYFWGKGVPQHYGEALKWLRRSAGGDFPLGQTTLGKCFYFPSG